MSNEQKVFDDFFDEWRQHDEAMYRLYQAAPDLLAACEGAIEMLTDDEEDRWPADDPARPIVAAIRAAITKATGQS